MSLYFNCVCSHCKKTMKGLNRLNIHSIHHHNTFVEFQFSNKKMVAKQIDKERAEQRNKQKIKQKKYQMIVQRQEQRQIEEQRNKQMIKQQQIEEQRQNICKHCNYNASSEFDLEAHIDYNSDNLVCCLCNYKTHSSTDLVTHEGNVHPDISKMNASNDGSLNANITIKENERKIHLKRKPKDKTKRNLKQTKPNKETKEQDNKCVMCGDQFDSDFDLMHHEDKVHIKKETPHEQQKQQEKLQQESQEKLQEELQEKLQQVQMSEQSEDQDNTIDQEQSEVPENTTNQEKVDKKRKFSCTYCPKQYVYMKGLKSHEAKHLQNPNPQDLIRILNEIKSEQTQMKITINEQVKNNQQVANKFEEVDNKLDRVNSELNFNTALRAARHAERNDYSKDKKKKYVIRITGFDCISQKRDKKELMLTVKKKIKKILLKLKFSITRAEHYQPKRNKDVVDVWFSECTDVSKVFSKLNDYCKSKKEMNVIRPTCTATRIRFNILETIGKKVQKKSKNKKNWRVEYVKMKPNLIISKKGGSVKHFRFTEAVNTFRDLVKSSDFQEAKELCGKFGFKGKEKDQFIFKF